MHSTTTRRTPVFPAVSTRAQAILLFALYATFWTSTPASAQPPTGESIQLFQQQFIEEEQRQRELKDAAALSPYNRPLPGPVEEAAPAQPSGQCIEIQQILFTGNQVFSDRRIRELIAPYEQRCLTIEEINSVLRDITNAYLDKSYTTSRAYMIMPQPRLQEGILEITIIEGKISGFEGISTGERVTAFPGLEGRVLNLRAI